MGVRVPKPKNWESPIPQPEGWNPAVKNNPKPYRDECTVEIPISDMEYWYKEILPWIKRNKLSYVNYQLINRRNSTSYTPRLYPMDGYFNLLVKFISRKDAMTFKLYWKVDEDT
jgi:hypothetical protein